MRIRPLVALSTFAAATLLLAGCAGSATPESSVKPDATPPADSACMLDAQPGTASDAIVVDGEGIDAKVSLPEGTVIDTIQRTVLSAGTGDDVVENSLVSLRYQIIDAATGEVLDSSARGEDGLLPVLLEPQQASLFVAALECEPLGSQVVVALPASAFGEGASDILVYAEAVAELPTVAQGEAVEPEAGMPTVTLADDGAPTVTIPDADEPTVTKVSVLIQGEGPVVAAGDMVTVQYLGVKWSDGTEFDSSWSRGAPAQFQTNQVVTGFKKALEGQKVGSQVVVVMPPSEGYGANAGHELEKESLVFVVDILAASAMQ